MKIAFVGTSGVGKTTLAEALLDLDLGWDFYHIKERSRSIITTFGKTSPKQITDEDEMKLFQDSLVRSQLAEETISRDFITDRCYVDYTSYAHIFIKDHQWLDVYDDLCRRCQRHARYDLLFYIPPKLKEEDDGVRYLGDTRQLADSNIRKALSRWNVQHHVIEPVDLRARIAFCVEQIRAVQATRQGL